MNPAEKLARKILRTQMRHIELPYLENRELRILLDAITLSATDEATAPSTSLQQSSESNIESFVTVIPRRSVTTAEHFPQPQTAVETSTQRNCFLRLINISHGAFDDEGLKILIDFLERHPGIIEHLNLSHNPNVSQHAIHDFCERINGLCERESLTLKTLDIKHCQCDVGVVQQIFNHTTLEIICEKNQFLDWDRLQAEACVLQKNPLLANTPLQLIKAVKGYPTHVIIDTIHSVAYVRQSHCAFLELSKTDKSNHFLGTSGLAPCRGIVIYDRVQNKVCLSHMDSAAIPHMDRYIGLFINRLRCSSIDNLVVTIVRSPTEDDQLLKSIFEALRNNQINIWQINIKFSMESFVFGYKSKTVMRYIEERHNIAKQKKPTTSTLDHPHALEYFELENGELLYIKPSAEVIQERSDELPSTLPD